MCLTLICAIVFMLPWARSYRSGANRVPNSETFDFIIVGAGSAGCVLANRLTASGQHRVLLLEAGPSDGHPWLHIPLGFGKLFSDRRFNWCYATEPQPECHNREVIAPRGNPPSKASIAGMPVETNSNKLRSR